MTSFKSLIDGLRAVFLSGRTRNIEWRRGQLKQILSMLDEEKPRFHEALKKDLGKPAGEANIMEIDFTRNEVSEAINSLKEWTGPQKVKKGLVNIMDDAFILSEPLGVVLNIGAWNYPVQLILGPLIGAIAAGNCVVLKPSELSANTATLFEEIIPKYMDNDCVKVVTGGPKETSELLKEKFDSIFYTGSTTVAKIIYEAAAKHLTPVTLELGGKSPVFVDDNSDLYVAARRIAWGKFCNSGQTCIAPDYVLCSANVQKGLVEELKKAISDFYGENPKDSPDYGRIVNERHFKRVKQLMDGGNVAHGGTTDETTLYIEPTVFTDVKENDLIMKEEIFGPLLPIMTIESADEAIKFINSREKPLSLYIFSKKKSTLNKFLQTTSSGNVCLNDCLMHASVLALPFGGVGNSGFGASHGKFSFDAFSHRKGCLWRGQSMEKVNELRYPPYTDRKNGYLNMVTRKNPKAERGMLSFLPFIIMGILIGAFMKFLRLH